MKKKKKKKHALSPLVLNFASEYAIRNKKENPEWLKLTGIWQALIYADGKIIELKHKYYQEKPHRFIIHYYEGWFEVVNAEKTKVHFHILWTECRTKSHENTQQIHKKQNWNILI